MKKLLLLTLIVALGAVSSGNAQCISAITTDTTETSVFIRFTKTAGVKKVRLYYSATDTVVGSMTLHPTTFKTSPIIIDRSQFGPGDTLNARLRGYWASDSIVCTTNKFVFATPSFSVDSCSTPGGLKAFVVSGYAYLSWNSGFTDDYTLKVTEVGGSTTTYSSLTVCQKAVPVKPGTNYTWSVKANCSTGVKTSDGGTFTTKQ